MAWILEGSRATLWEETMCPRYSSCSCTNKHFKWCKNCPYNKSGEYWILVRKIGIKSVIVYTKISSKTAKNQYKNNLWSSFMVARNVEGELQSLKGMTSGPSEYKRWFYVCLPQPYRSSETLGRSQAWKTRMCHLNRQHWESLLWWSSLGLCSQHKGTNRYPFLNKKSRRKTALD